MDQTQFSLANMKDFPSLTSEKQSKRSMRNSHLAQPDFSSLSVHVPDETVTQEPDLSSSASAGLQTRMVDQQDWSRTDDLVISLGSLLPRCGNKLPVLELLASGEELSDFISSAVSQHLPLAESPHVADQPTYSLVNTTTQPAEFSSLSVHVPDETVTQEPDLSSSASVGLQTRTVDQQDWSRTDDLVISLGSLLPRCENKLLGFEQLASGEELPDLSSAAISQHLPLQKSPHVADQPPYCLVNTNEFPSPTRKTQRKRDMRNSHLTTTTHASSPSFGVSETVTQEPDLTLASDGIKLSDDEITGQDHSPSVDVAETVTKEPDL